MFVIGELINGMYKNVAKAIKEKDKKTIADLALRQVKEGADALDVNTGPSTNDPIGAVKWMVEIIQQTSPDATIVLDSTKKEVIEEGLKLCKKPAIINSTSADMEKLESLVGLAKNYNAGLIGLTMSKKGIPRDKMERTKLALHIVSYCHEQNFDIRRLYLDPIVLPVNVAQPQAHEVLESMREFKLLSDPPPKTVVGLSNVSQGTKNRPLINMTFLVMAVSSGLDSAILDPLDKPLMDAMITAELILNKNIYCDSYLDAYRKR